jgi:hypothetical protein
VTSAPSCKSFSSISITGPTRCTICFQFITINSFYMFRALICSSSGCTVNKTFKSVVAVAVVVVIQIYAYLPKSRSNLKILGIRRVTYSNLHNEHPQILVPTAQNSVTTANWRPESVHHCTGRGISRLTPLWGISRLTPLYPTNGPGSQYIVVGGVNPASQVRTTSRSWDKGVLTDLGLTGELTDLCPTL